MKESVNFYRFERAFAKVRPNNFSYKGLKALFEYLEEFEDDTGEEIELDVIAICCDYSEYGDSIVALEEYAGDDETEELLADLDEDERYEAAMDYFEQKTTVIRTGDVYDPIIIANY